eukprot:gene3750-biopygen8273
MARRALLGVGDLGSVRAPLACPAWRGNCCAGFLAGQLLRGNPPWILGKCGTGFLGECGTEFLGECGTEFLGNSGMGFLGNSGMGFLGNSGMGLLEDSARATGHANGARTDPRSPTPRRARRAIPHRQFFFATVSSVSWEPIPQQQLPHLGMSRAGMNLFRALARRKNLHRQTAWTGSAWPHTQLP